MAYYFFTVRIFCSLKKRDYLFSSVLEQNTSRYMYLYCQNDINPHSSLYRDIMTVPFFKNKYAQPLLADNVTFQADRGSLFLRSQNISFPNNSCHSFV